MMIDNEDRPFDQWLQEAAKTYHSPLPTPREAMWGRIAAARRRRPWLRWTLAAAAVLALGIGLGRWTARPETADSAATLAADTAGNGVVYRVAATQYLSRAEALLTEFRADAQQGAADASFVRSARELLTTTRLMLDSPAARDARLETLLEDLELVLAQIVQLTGARRAEEVDLIQQGLEQRGVLTRLRTAIPAGAGVGTAQGVL